MSDIPVIAFGPRPDIYYIGLGMRYYAPGMPASAQGTISKWPAIQIKWMSIDADGAFMARDAYSSRVEYDTRVTPDAISKLHATPAAEYITFGPNKKNFCAIMSGGTWSSYLENENIKNLRVIEASVGGPDVFNRALDGILFGKGSTMIFMFKNCFSYYTDHETENTAVEKLMDDYINRQPPWTIERGSALCQWNVNYYFLKFRNTQTNAIMMHWNLPDAMAQQLADLKASFATQESKQAIANHQQQGMIQATNNFALAVHANNAMRAVFFPSQYGYY
ncbi:hypothetical protein JR316_0001735 [Psilocybe cubensis]|uniref:Uncharacterized protein n=2 Tax=Psilocybe cubensis TaxID=181762 RepID=A0A8H7Y4F6_PSICU|nr:hypothetical protein JR316_0001735 [Psilocybe cubensis]KAH9484833.1 hypothetical protein JR316_0001735 [Psilocybe cubensis]